MSDAERRWIGQSIAGRYLLGKYLGGTDHSSVFATEIVHARAQRVAIKLIPAEGIVIGRQLARWKVISALSHANLLKILDYGKCDLDGSAYLFVVMELADENLAEILPQRMLSADETRGMIEPVIEALSFLHGQNLVHTHVHPGNIMATGDQIKLSSDAISPKGEAVSFVVTSGAFSPPEWNTSSADAAEDVWSLGATVVAALTQAAPAFTENGEVLLPAELPEPFAGIARESLKKNTAERITMARIRAKMNPASAPAQKQPARIEPVAAPLSQVSLPTVSAPPRQVPVASERSSGAPKSYFLPIAVVAVVAFLLFTVPRLLRQRTDAAASKAHDSAAPSTPKQHAASATTKPATKRSAPPQSAVTETAERVAPAPAPPVKPASKSSEGDATRGEVLDQVLPDISGKARATIQGKVRVSLRLHVNATGTVDSAELETPASSKYFSEQAIKAAKRWQFSAPEVNGRSAGSEWVVRFEFTPSTTNVFPKQVLP